jgi:ABC-2 type transport system ATP-binding protein
MLKISHIPKNFEKINALKDVSLNIHQGEFFGLSGPNGAGKIPSSDFVRNIRQEKFPIMVD